jgi:hypothetical protein
MALLFEIRFCTGIPGKFQILTDMPLLCGSAPGKIGKPAIGSLAGQPPAALPDSGEVAAGVGGEWVEEASWLT